MQMNAARLAAGCALAGFLIAAPGCAITGEPTVDPPPDENPAPASVAHEHAREPVCRARTGCDPECVEPGRYLATRDLVLDEDHGGRTWQRSVRDRGRTWSEAASYCAGLRIEGEGGFRLPKLRELESLVLDAGGLEAGHPGYCAPAIDQAAFPRTPEEFFWTSEADPKRGVATYVNFFDGRTADDVVDAEHLVRCVR